MTKEEKFPKPFRNFEEDGRDYQYSLSNLTISRDTLSLKDYMVIEKNDKVHTRKKLKFNQVIP
jgi:hypothetical protein